MLYMVALMNYYLQGRFLISRPRLLLRAEAFYHYLYYQYIVFQLNATLFVGH